MLSFQALERQQDLDTRDMRDQEPTTKEVTFFQALTSRVEGVQDWYHRDADGSAWMTASVDVLEDGRMFTTWRCDYDGHRLLGGRSPANLNWDDGVRAIEAGVKVSAADGLDATEPDPYRAAQLAASWFLNRVNA